MLVYVAYVDMVYQVVDNILDLVFSIIYTMVADIRYRGDMGVYQLLNYKN
jgi:hypothetical protein